MSNYEEVASTNRTFPFALSSLFLLILAFPLPSLSLISQRCSHSSRALSSDSERDSTRFERNDLAIDGVSFFFPCSWISSKGRKPNLPGADHPSFLPSSLSILASPRHPSSRFFFLRHPTFFSTDLTSHDNNRATKDPLLVETYSALLKQTSPHEKSIGRDLNRTFPKHSYFKDSDGVGQQNL